MPAARAEITVTASTAEAQAKLEELAVKTGLVTDEMQHKVGMSSSKMGGSLSSLGNQMSNFGLPMGKATQKIGSELDQAGGHAKGFGGMMNQYGGMASLAVLGVGVAVAKTSVQAAMSFDDLQTSLHAAVTASGQSWGKYSAQITQVEKSQTGLGYSMIDVAGALKQGVISTQSVTKSMSLLPVAEDLATVKGLGLNQAMLLVVKASEGQLRPLKQLGIDLPFVAGGAAKLATAQHKLAIASQAVLDFLHNYPGAQSATNAAHAKYEVLLTKQTQDQQKVNVLAGEGAKIVAVLAASLAGQAAAAARTLSGKTKTLNADFTDMKVEIGSQLIPKLSLLAGGLTGLMGIMQGNWTSSNFWTMANNFGPLLNQAFLSMNPLIGGLQKLGGLMGLVGPGTTTVSFNPATLTPAEKAAIKNYQHTHHGKTPPGVPKNWSPTGGSSTMRHPNIGNAASTAATGNSATYNVTIVNPDPHAVVNALVQYSRKNGAIRNVQFAQ